MTALQMKKVLPIVGLLSLTAQTPMHAQGNEPVTITVQRSGQLQAVVEIAVVALNGVKQPGTLATGNNTATFPFDALNAGKPVTVYVDECDDGARVLIVPDGVQLSQPPANCRRRRLGVFWWTSGAQVVIDTGAGTVAGPDNGGGGALKKVLWIAVPVAAAATGGGIYAANRGDDSPNASPVNILLEIVHQTGVHFPSTGQRQPDGTFRATGSEVAISARFKASTANTGSVNGNNMTLQHQLNVTGGCQGAVIYNISASTSSPAGASRVFTGTATKASDAGCNFSPSFTVMVTMTDQ